MLRREVTAAQVAGVPVVDHVGAAAAIRTVCGDAWVSCDRLSEGPVKALIECARCQVPRGKRACDSRDGAAPRGCPTRHADEALAAAERVYQDPQVRHFAVTASCQEAAGYSDRTTGARPALTRIEEVCEFAARAGFRRLSVAFCAGLVDEARRLDEVLVARGFDVVSAVCKVGAVAKEALGLADEDKVRPGTFETLCNPILQAELLNRAGAELNILLDLCVGHDALFLGHAVAPCTVLAVKDRVLGHNPLAALFTSGSYYRRLLAGDGNSAAGLEVPGRGATKPVEPVTGGRRRRG